MLGIVARLILSFMLVVSLWSGVMAAPFSGSAMNKSACCHARSMAGHAGGQGACGCSQDSPCRMQANPYARSLPALIHSNVDQTSLAEFLMGAFAGNLIVTTSEKVFASRILLKPPDRLFILHANLSI